MIDILTRFNWTAAPLILAVLGIFIVEGFRILGRASNPKTERTKFDAAHYFGQFQNWFSLVLSAACALVLLAIGHWTSGRLGLEGNGANDFEMAWAFLSGAIGQAIIKILLKGVLGAIGAFSGAPKVDPQP